MLSRRIRSALVVAALVVPGVAVGTTAASAQSCGSAAGVGKRVNNGVTEYYEDTRCGNLNRDGSARPTPAPRPSAPASSAWGCRAYPNGQLCGVGVGQPRHPMSTSTWQRLYGSGPVGTVTVGPITTVGGGSGGSAGSGGTVTVGGLEQIKQGAEKSAE